MIPADSRMMRGWANGWDYSDEIMETAEHAGVTRRIVHEALREIYKENKGLYDET